MKSKSIFFLAPIIGIICGVLSTQAFSIGWLNLVFWCVVAIAVGMLCNEREAIMWVGLLYGFFLSVAFLATGFKGSADKILSFVILSFSLSIIGGLCEWLFVYIGYRLRGFIKSSH
jgi:hypothetical protein